MNLTLSTQQHLNNATFCCDDNDYGSVFNWETTFGSVSFTSDEAIRLYTKFGIGFAIFNLLPWIGPLLVYFIVFSSSVAVWLNDIKRKCNSGYTLVSNDDDFLAMCRFLKPFYSFWYGAEVEGLENCPKTPAIYAQYHGTTTMDCLSIYYHVRSHINNPLRAISHRAQLLTPGFGGMHRALKAGAYNREECIKILEEESLHLAPGGIKESRHTNNKYPLIWNKELGFIAVAMKANVPVVPCFTRNINEAFWIPWYIKPFLPNRVRCVPAVGGLPVKFISFIGEPIYPDENTTTEEFADKVMTAMKDLIRRVQPLPGNRLRALWERVQRPKITVNNTSSIDV